jgi:1-pyrroline-5-carboxylate dehydrogenase
MQPHPFENELTLPAHRERGALEKFHAAYDDAIATVEAELGASHPLVIDGEDVATDEAFTVTSPADTDLEIGTFAAGTAEHVDDAVNAATAAFDAWRARDVSERVAIFRRAAERMRDRKFELAATLTIENGKTRAEAMADVDEAIDFLRFYSRELDRNDGYQYDTGEPTPDQHCSNGLEPYGVFGVIGPFNFPCAIFTGMTAGAAITGNAVVAKPASATPLIGYKVVEILSAAGVPDGALNLVTGGGRAVGTPLVEHDDVDGIVFTGSRAVGDRIRRTFIELDKRGPVIAELGGKNPVVVTDTADLGKAVSGVANGAFGYSGQKCSATSRVYVDETVFEPFTRKLVSAAEDLPIRQPRDPEAFVSPLIDDDALERYREICEAARRDGEVLTGGSVVSSPELSAGRFVEPTVVRGIPHDHDLAREEHFLPFVTIHPVAGLDEAIRKSNDSSYGLCAGLFSEDPDEVDTWLDRIESGMCYVNRERSATTGALVQAQPFGGWKASGTTGKFAGGYWYLPQFLREQSRTVVGDVGRS